MHGDTEGIWPRPNLQNILQRFWYEQVVVPKAGRFYGWLFRIKGGVNQGYPFPPNYFQHCDGQSGKGGAAGSLRSTGGTAWIWLGVRRAQNSLLFDLFQPKTSTISTRALISVHFKTVRYFSQPIFRLFSYFKNALHNLVIELCNALIFLKNIYSYILTSRTVL